MDQAIMDRHIGAGVAIGVGVGLALGSATGNVGAGIAIGIAVGSSRSKVDKDSTSPDEQGSDEDPRG